MIGVRTAYDSSDLLLRRDEDDRIAFERSAPLLVLDDYSDVTSHKQHLALFPYRLDLVLAFSRLVLLDVVYCLFDVA